MSEQHPCLMEARVRSLETGQAETKVYVKMLIEKLDEIAAEIKQQREQHPPLPPPVLPPPAAPQPTSPWQPIVLELIKLVALAVTILGGIAGVAKILGK